MCVDGQSYAALCVWMGSPMVHCVCGCAVLCCAVRVDVQSYAALCVWMGSPMVHCVCGCAVLCCAVRVDVQSYAALCVWMCSPMLHCVCGCAVLCCTVCVGGMWQEIRHYMQVPSVPIVSLLLHTPSLHTSAVWLYACCVNAWFQYCLKWSSKGSTEWSIRKGTVSSACKLVVIDGVWNDVCVCMCVHLDRQASARCVHVCVVLLYACVPVYMFG